MSKPADTRFQMLLLRKHWLESINALVRAGILTEREGIRAFGRLKKKYPMEEV